MTVGRLPLSRPRAVVQIALTAWRRSSLLSVAGRLPGHGHILLDSSKRPGLIVDVAAVRADTAKQHQKELAALWRGWLRGLDYLKTHPDESYQIMAKGVGGWLNDPKLFADTTKGIKYLDQAGNRQLFGSAAAPGSLYKTLGYAMDIWREKGRLKVNAKPADIIDNSLVSK